MIEKFTPIKPKLFNNFIERKVIFHKYNFFMRALTKVVNTLTKKRVL